MLREIVNKLFLMKQKSFLLSEKARLEKEIKNVKTFPIFGDTEEANSREVEQFERQLGLEKSMSQLLNDVNAALNRLEKNKYGICQVCNGQIEKGRLEAFPAAVACVQCTDKLKK